MGRDRRYFMGEDLFDEIRDIDARLLRIIIDQFVDRFGLDHFIIGNLPGKDLHIVQIPDGAAFIIVYQSEKHDL